MVEKEGTMLPRQGNGSKPGQELELQKNAYACLEFVIVGVAKSSNSNIQTTVLASASLRFLMALPSRPGWIRRETEQSPEGRLLFLGDDNQSEAGL